MADLIQIDGNNDNLAVSGQGIDFGSKLFALKPATLSINQRMTQVEGAIPGKLRISETGEQFDSLTVVLMSMPKEQRDYHLTTPGVFNKSADTLLCFSRDMVKPDVSAKDPQAFSCKGCKRADWAPWRNNKIPANIPPCDICIKAMFIDTINRIPLNMYIRSGNKAIFEAAMQTMARTFAKMKAAGKNPNIFDVSFTLSSQPSPKMKTAYILKIDGSSFKEITDTERAAFGNIYLNHVNKDKPTAEEAEVAQQQEQQQSVDNVIEADGVIEI